MTGKLDIVIFGLSLSSSWGNGHATTYRALLRGLDTLGHRVLFLERDVPWYASQRDLRQPDFCELVYYDDLNDALATYRTAIETADAVIIGSYVPEGVTLIDRVVALRPRQLCFYDIDTPVTLAKLDRGDEEYLAKRQIAFFDTYFSFSGGAVLRRLEGDYGARQAADLYCSVDAEKYKPMDEPLSWDLGYLGTYSPDRQPALEKLLIEPARRLPEKRFVVAGPQYPNDINWPQNVERIEHLAPDRHPAFYSRQRFTLNITRADMIAAGWSPSVRLFEAAACGVPIISDWWQGLDEIFETGKALRVAHTTEDVVATLSNMPDERRQAIADAASDIVLRHHTGLARASQLAATIAARQIQHA
ncbi:CgeB family protein [Limoniibacter endophyticus]|uniref:Glycosyl transferase n=1 Tax=Limoniibacter endophyticus TaxID=1565040 RepID=A0A8J3DJ35_9HYPH|nr:glycosyltransferase [Limoniibacter endophyticus]GHC72355.1 glycosyl transferase [Limoniibacter endophyticus]